MINRTDLEVTDEDMVATGDETMDRPLTNPWAAGCGGTFAKRCDLRQAADVIALVGQVAGKGGSGNMRPKNS